MSNLKIDPASPTWPTGPIEEDDHAFSSIDLVEQCLADEARTQAFGQAIASVEQPHHLALDLGAGSGILALFAARAGAQRVIAIEYDRYVAAVARENFRRNWAGDAIRLIEADARNHVFGKGLRFDLVIAEMLTTGLIDEAQVQAINNLHRQGVVTRDTTFIPARQETFATLAHTDFEIYGFEMPMVRHIWEGINEDQEFRLLSRRELLNSINFARPQPEDFAAKIDFEITESGVVNSLYLTSRSCLTETISLDDTPTLNAPVLLPIDEIEVREGERISLGISYRFGGGYRRFRIRGRKAERERLL
jgi:predicted RNA methylase